MQVRSSLGRFEVYVQQKVWQIDPVFCVIHLYRICIIRRVSGSLMLMNETKVTEGLKTVQKLKDTYASPEIYRDSTTMLQEDSVLTHSQHA
jgi:hypothetical protein